MKRILTAITLLTALFTAISCLNEESFDQEYAQVLSFKTYGIQEVALSLEEPIFDYAMTILKGGTDAGKPVTACLTVLSQEEVDAEYNEKKGFSYRALPSDLFDAPEKIEIGADASGIKVPVSFHAQDMYREVKDDENTYALVVRLTTEQGSVHKEKQDIVIVPKFSPADLRFAATRSGVKLEKLTETPVPITVSYNGNKSQSFSLAAMSQEYVTEYYAGPEQVNYVAVDPSLYEIPTDLTISQGTKETSVSLKLKAADIIAEMSKQENLGKVYVIPLKLTPVSDLVISSATEMLLVCDADIVVVPTPGEGTGPYTWEVSKANLDALSVASSAQKMGTPAISWSLDAFKGAWPKDDTDAGRGVQLGQSGTQTEITLTTTEYKGLVKAVVVRAAVAWDSAADNTADISVYVNGELVDNHIPSIANNGFMNTDYMFMLKTPKVNPTIRVVYRSNLPKATFLKSISILDKAYFVENMTDKSKWTTPYMTLNECGWVVKANVLFDGVEVQDAFLSHQVDEWRGDKYKFGKPFIVVDLGEPVMISELGYASSKSRWGRFIKEVEFFVYKGETLPQVIDAEKDWSAILNYNGSENQGYVEVHKKMLTNDATINWESVGSVREPNTHLTETYWHKVPYSIMEQTKVRYIKLLITPFQRYWEGTTSSTGMVDRCEVNEIYVKRVVSIDDTPVN